MSLRADRLLILLLLAVVLAGLLLRPLAEPDEGRYGETAREMAASGDWLLPRQAGVVYPDKPPGVYWAMAASLSALGPSAAALRLPAYLALLATALLVHRHGRRVFGAEGAAAAVLILLAEPLLLALGQLATLDMVLTAATTAALLAGRRLQRDGGWRPALGAGSALGFAFLVKGPVGPALVCAILLAAGLADRRRGSLRRLLHPGLWSCFLALGLPWYLAAAAAEPGLRDFWIGRELVGRLASDVHARAQPWWFFPALAAAVALPWGLGVACSPQRRAARLALAAAERRFLALWAFLPILLFSLPAGKQPAYFAPALPGLALWLASWWGAPTARRARRAIAAAWLLLAAAACAWHLDPLRGRSDDALPAALRAGGAATWPGAQFLSWSYGLTFRLARTDLECLGPPPKAWAYAEAQGAAPPRLRREGALDRAVELLGGSAAAFVVVHEPERDGRRLAELTARLGAAGVPVWRWPARAEAALLANRAAPGALAVVPAPGAPPGPAGG